jgi:hypothetical protein
MHLWDEMELSSVFRLLARQGEKDEAVFGSGIDLRRDGDAVVGRQHVHT